MDDAGQLLVRGPMLLRCYRDGTDPKDSDGWLPTGDLGAVDRGLVQVHGRASDVIVTGGEKVWPEPVEEALRHEPGIADVAVAGEPDPEWGQRVVAYVVPDPAGTVPTLEDLRLAVKRRLPAFCAPRQLVLMEELPTTPLGKPRRASLGRARLGR